MERICVPIFKKPAFYIAIPLFLFMLFTCTFIFFTDSHAESTGVRVDDVAKYESVLICRGDSLWSIAETNLDHPTNRQIQSYVDEIMSLNNLSCTSIHAGKYILIPKYY